MKDNRQPARTGTDSDTVLATNCSICRGRKTDQREAINKALGKGMPYRDIEALTGVAYRTVGNHAAHLPAIYREAKEAGILNQAVDVEGELREQLAFAKELRAAAREYLTDPETGMLNLILRSSEIAVVYEDYADTKPNGEPKRKTDTLDVLLERVKTGSFEPIRTISRHTDIRSFALDSIRTTDTVLDKFAKISGAYAKDNQQKQPVTYAVALKQKFIAYVRVESGGDPVKARELYTDLVELAVKSGSAAEKDLEVDANEFS